MRLRSSGTKRTAEGVMEIRRQIGIDHHMSLLTEKEAREIYLSPLSYRTLARSLNISVTTIFNIKHKIAWRTLTDEIDRTK